MLQCMGSSKHIAADMSACRVLCQLHHVEHSYNRLVKRRASMPRHQQVHAFSAVDSNTACTWNFTGSARSSSTSSLPDCTSSTDIERCCGKHSLLAVWSEDFAELAAVISLMTCSLNQDLRSS